VKKINLLIIEDSEDDALINIKALQRDGYDVEYEIIDSEKDFKKALNNNEIDAIIADFNVPGFYGNRALEVFKEAGKDIPFIVVSGSITGEEAARILKSGAHDFIDKSNLMRLSHAVNREIAESVIRKKQREDELKLKQREKELGTALEQTIEIIGDIVEKRDPYTAGHQRRVSKLAMEIAKDLGLPDKQLEILKFSSLIHDLGKIVIPASILSRPGKLSDIEMEMIKSHPVEAFEILKKNNSMESYRKIIIQHHERINGSGYPLGIKGDKILIEAKILSVADVVEAMMSHRPYRPALGLKAALDEITQNKGILYESKVVDSCVSVFLQKGFKF